MKLVMMYTFWAGDDQEMLIDSISHHKTVTDCIDKFIVCIQIQSNKGGIGQMNSSTIKALHDMNVSICYYSPKSGVNTKGNEMLKHNFMLGQARKEGATHFILSAADHFYKSRSFDSGIHAINNGYDVTLTKMFTYYKSKDWALYPIESYYMPFICQLKPETKYNNGKYPVLCDPSVMVFPANKILVFNPKIAVFDHYSMIRTDIKKKFGNAAASIRWSEKQVNQFITEYDNAKLGDEISYFSNRILVDKKIIHDLYGY